MTTERLAFGVAEANGCGYRIADDERRIVVAPN